MNLKSESQFKTQIEDTKMLMNKIIDMEQSTSVEKLASSIN